LCIISLAFSKPATCPQLFLNSELCHHQPKKQTAAKKQQPPSMLSLSPPAAPTISNPNPTTMAKISAIDFCTFIQHAKLDDINKFLELASTTQDGQNLAFF
jgi:hypothetical protein